MTNLMAKLLFVMLVTLSTITMAQKKNVGPKVFDLVIGTYTGDAPTASKGIYVYRFYEESGKVAYLSEVETPNPSFWP
jgi:6-phosphogluconolactonase